MIEILAICGDRSWRWPIATRGSTNSSTAGQNRGPSSSLCPFRSMPLNLRMPAKPSPKCLLRGEITVASTWDASASDRGSLTPGTGE
jgi:hypothetical protein